MLDPWTALSLATSAVQFVDFSSKLISKGVELYRSADGSLVENRDIETANTDLQDLVSRLKGCLSIDSSSTSQIPNPEEQALLRVCDGCLGVATDLSRRLERLSIDDDSKHRRWQSFRKALRSVWSKEGLESTMKRLDMFRSELELHLLVSLK